MEGRVGSTEHDVNDPLLSSAIQLFCIATLLFDYLVNAAEQCNREGDTERMDHQAGVHPTERRGEQDLLRATLHRGKLWPAGAAARTARAGARLRGGSRLRSENSGQRRWGAVSSAGSVAVAHSPNVFARPGS